jgi:GNAT superfamily N-acetyltransferase
MTDRPLRDSRACGGLAPIRPFVFGDEDAIVALSLRAWAPVFQSLHDELGRELALRLHGGDWREHQTQVVRALLEDELIHVWVAARVKPVGFVAVKPAHSLEGIGEVAMLAVDPEHQRRGLGRALFATATEWLHAQGCVVAMVDTGADPGHAPARRLYESAGYVGLGLARYFKVL